MKAEDEGSEALAGEVPHQFLRRVTRGAHAHTETAFAPFDLAARAGLAGFLQAQARAIVPIEDAMDRLVADRLLPDWPQRRRAAALHEDLRLLGVEPPALRLGEVGFETDDHVWGALYVLEGSRLGGAMLKRIVEGSTDADVRSAQRFLAHTPGPGGWRRFLAALDAAEFTAASAPRMRDAALAVFAMFQKAAEAVAKIPYEGGADRFVTVQEGGDSLVGARRA